MVYLQLDCIKKYMFYIILEFESQITAIQSSSNEEESSEGSSESDTEGSGKLSEL